VKLAHILYSGLGGHSSVVFSFIEAENNQEFEHVLIFFGIEDMPVAYLNKCKELKIAYYAIKKNPGLDIASQKKITGLLKEISPNVILLHSVNLILPIFKYTIGKKIKLISIEHQANELKTKREWIGSFFVMLLSDKVVYLTESYKNQIKNKLRFVFKTNKVSIINNGINIDLFKPADFVNERNLIRIGMLSRLTAIKDHLTLIDAFKLLLDKAGNKQEMMLLLAGEGETKKSLMEKVNDLKLQDNVVFCGMLSEMESVTFLNSLDIYVHASFGETMSTAIMQAMACAKAMIVSDVDGINNMVTNNITGLLVPTQNKEVLANTLEKLLADKELQKKLGHNAVEFAQENYSNKFMYKKYKALID